MLPVSFVTALSFCTVLTAQAPQSPPAAPGGAAGASTAQQQVERLLHATRELDAVAFWDWLPSSYQDDVEGLAHDLAARIDGKTYDRAARLLHRFATVALDKQQYVFGNRTVTQTMRSKGASAHGAEDAYAAFCRLLQHLAGGELGSVEGLRQFDGRTFAASSGKALLETVFALARAQGKNPIEGLAAMRVRTLGEHDGEVRIEVTAPDRDAEVTTFVQVEGRWLPVQMARGWQKGLGELRAKVAAMPAKADAKLSAQAGLLLGMAEGFVKKLEDVESQQDFDAVVGELMAMTRGGRPDAR